MSIQLTEHQLHVLDEERDEPHRVIDPRSNTAYLLVREQDYEVLREIAEDTQCQADIHAIGLRNAAARMDEVP